MDRSSGLTVQRGLRSDPAAGGERFPRVLRVWLLLAGLVVAVAWYAPGRAAAGQAATGSDAPPQVSGAPAAQPAPEMTAEEKADEAIGKSAAEVVEKKFKVVADSPALPRLAAVMARLEPVSQKPHLTYKVKVVSTSEVNAFSLPGGYLYFTTGLIDAVESDDELAAVAAHEMAHICLGHSRQLMAKSDRYSRVLTPLVLAAILTQSRAVDPGAVMVVGSLVVEDAINGYGRAAELEADHQAVLYLRDTKAYNPVAMLTVAEGLAHLESQQVPIVRIEGRAVPAEAGVSQTHPDPQERVAAITRELNEFGIPIERRRVTKSLVATAATAQVSGREVGELRMTCSKGGGDWSATVFQPAATVEGSGPVTRAQRAADLLNSLLLANLQGLEITTAPQDDQILVQARGQTLFSITAEDAAFHQTTVEKLADQAIQALRQAFQEERVSRWY